MANQESTADLLERLDRARRLAEEVMKLESTLDAKRRELSQLAGEALPRGATSALNELQDNLGPPDAGRTSKILWILKSNKGRPMTAKDISKLIKDDDIQAISSMLVRLSKRTPQVTKQARGKYVSS